MKQTVHCSTRSMSMRPYRSSSCRCQARTFGSTGTASPSAPRHDAFPEAAASFTLPQEQRKRPHTPPGSRRHDARSAIGEHTRRDAPFVVIQLARCTTELSFLRLDRFEWGRGGCARVPHLDDNGLLQPQDWIMANQNPGAVGATAANWPRFIAARRHRLPADGHICNWPY
jgi:hypothetical protein